MTQTQKLVLVLLCCTAVAWLTGPPGRMLVVLGVLLLAPGYLLERLLAADAAAPPPAAFVLPALWLGLSLCLVALLYTWSTALGVVLSLPLLALLVGGCALGAAWHLWWRPLPPSPASRLALWALLVVFALTLWTRFSQIQGLVLPAWVDSVHHALIIRVAAEQGVAPYSLRPYLPIDQMPYHWGYHVFVASVLRLSGLALPQTMLWSGQILNTLHVLTAAALAASFWRQPRAGVVAGIVVGLLSLMPAYYVSWGRYTHLTGLLIVPPLAVAWAAWLRQPTRRWFVCTALLLAGLSIVHMRVFVFALGLLLAIGLLWALRNDSATLARRVRQSLPLGVLVLLLAGPWLWHLVLSKLLPAAEGGDSLTGGGNFSALNEGLLWTSNNRLLISLALLGGLLGLFRRSRAATIALLWVGILALSTNPWLLTYLLPMAGVLLALWAMQRFSPTYALFALANAVILVAVLLTPDPVRLPYFSLLTNDSLVISLFLPLSLLMGGGVWLLYEWLGRRGGRYRLPLQAGLIGALVLATLWGTWDSRTIINPDTVFATPADLAAITWVAENTPPDARFLVNATPWFTGVRVDRGTDGGFWLLPLAGRWTSTPPIVYIYGAPDFVQQVKTRSSFIAGFQEDQQEYLFEMIERERITHIYLGQDAAPLTPELFADRSRFEQVYQQDGITIFAVQRQS